LYEQRRGVSVSMKGMGPGGGRVRGNLRPVGWGHACLLKMLKWGWDGGTRNCARKGGAYLGREEMWAKLVIHNTTMGGGVP